VDYDTLFHEIMSISEMKYEIAFLFKEEKLETRLVFEALTPCILADGYQFLEGTCFLHLQHRYSVFRVKDLP
jgi:hypothetical protein